MVEIYVDGSADNVKKEAPSYTAVWVPGHYVDIKECQARTNNEAEYLAVIAGMIKARELGLTGKVTIVSDSQLVINQLNGEWACKHDGMRTMRAMAVTEATKEPRMVDFAYRWCRREVNHAGVELDKYLNGRKAHA